MPYDVKKTGKDEYTVKKGGKTVGHTNKRNLRAYMGHLHSEDKPKKKMKKEGIEGALDTVYAVQKPYVGCQLTSLIKPIDPLVGLGGSEIVPEKVHAVYADQEMAQKAAQGLFEEFETQQKALEEKKSQVIDKIKKTMDELEKQRKGMVEMIKENPKDAHTHKERVAKIATQIDDLVDKLQKIEMSKKAIDKDKKEEKKEKKKEDIKEALKKALK